jgi:predicted PurR-regulated permease PerM
MLGVDVRAFRVIWTVFVFGLLLATVYAIRETLMLFALAVFFAYMLAPLVTLIERLTPRRRGIALMIVYVLLVGSLVTLGVNLGSQIADEASSFFSRLPGLLQQNKLDRFPLPWWLEPLRDRIVGALQNAASDVQASIVPLLQQAGGRILSGLTFLVLIVLVPLLSFFLLKDAREINQLILTTLEGAGDRIFMRQIVADIDLLLSQYIRALVLLAFVSFTAWAIFLYAVHAPYPLLLAGISGALEFIPGVGPAVAGATALLVCGISGYGNWLLGIAIFWVCFRLLQDYALSPYLMSSGVQLHPLLVLFAVFAGGHIGGIRGMFFSVPVIAILKVLVVRLREAHLRRTLTEHPVISG